MINFRRDGLARSLVDYVEEISAKRKQHWAEEQPKLDDARRLRGIECMDPEDTDFKETMNNARKKSELLVGSAMPCKLRMIPGKSS